MNQDMKRILFSYMLPILITGCNSETNTNENKMINTDQTLPQFQNVQEILANAYDYYKEDGSLKFISESDSNLHVQVSKPISDNDLESVKEEIVKRDIVYVAFQSFARTGIDKLTVTAVPNDRDNRKVYYEEYKKTVTVDRVKAKSVLKKYLNSEDFSVLYERDGDSWLPSKSFNKLKFENINAIYSELSSE